MPSSAILVFGKSKEIISEGIRIEQKLQLIVKSTFFTPFHLSGQFFSIYPLLSHESIALHRPLSALLAIVKTP